MFISVNKIDGRSMTKTNNFKKSFQYGPLLPVHRMSCETTTEEVSQFEQFTKSWDSSQDAIRVWGVFSSSITRNDTPSALSKNVRSDYSPTTHYLQHVIETPQYIRRLQNFLTLSQRSKIVKWVMCEAVSSG